MDRASFEASLRARARRRDVEGHPTPGELAAYHAGELTEEGEGQIQDHLTICEECARLLLSLSEFEQYRPEPEPAGGGDPSAAAWLRFRERLHEEKEAAAPAQEQEETRTAVLPLQRRRVPIWQRPLVAWAAAAVLALIVVGLEMRMGALREENRRLIATQPSTPILDLSADVQRSGGGEILEASGNNPILRLHLSDRDEEIKEYEGQILASSGGEPVVSGERLFPDPSDGALHFDLTRRPLPRGDYVVRVYGLGEGRPLIAEFPPFRIPR